MSNGSVGAPPISPAAQQVEAQLTSCIQQLHQLSKLTADFQSDDQGTWFGQINELVDTLGQLHGSSQTLHGHYVPLAVLESLDQGKNPDTYTPSIVKDTMQKTEGTRARKETFSHFADLLQSQVAPVLDTTAGAGAGDMDEKMKG